MIVVRITAATFGLDGTRDGFVVLITGREKQVVSEAEGRNLKTWLKQLWYAGVGVFDGFSYRFTKEEFDGIGI